MKSAKRSGQASLSRTGELVREAGQTEEEKFELVSSGRSSLLQCFICVSISLSGSSVVNSS